MESIVVSADGSSATNVALLGEPAAAPWLERPAAAFLLVSAHSF